MASRIAAGSAIRPGPYSPQAISPSSGPTTATPWKPGKAFNRSILAWTAGCSHIRTFIAGANSTRLSVAIRVVDARSSARPFAALAISPAVAGATTTRSAHRDSSIWPMLVSSSGWNSPDRTGCPLSAASDRGVTNSAPDSVRITRVCPPALAISRTSSSAL